MIFASVKTVKQRKAGMSAHTLIPASTSSGLEMHSQCPMATDLETKRQTANPMKTAFIFGRTFGF